MAQSQRCDNAPVRAKRLTREIPKHTHANTAARTNTSTYGKGSADSNRRISMRNACGGQPTPPESEQRQAEASNDMIGGAPRSECARGGRASHVNTAHTIHICPQHAIPHRSQAQQSSPRHHTTPYHTTARHRTPQQSNTTRTQTDTQPRPDAHTHIYAYKHVSIHTYVRVSFKCAGQRNGAPAHLMLFRTRWRNIVVLRHKP